MPYLAFVKMLFFAHPASRPRAKMPGGDRDAIFLNSFSEPYLI